MFYIYSLSVKNCCMLAIIAYNDNIHKYSLPNANFLKARFQRQNPKS